MTNSYNHKHKNPEGHEYQMPVRFERELSKTGYILEVLKMRYDSKARRFFNARHTNDDLTRRVQ